MIAIVGTCSGPLTAPSDAWAKDLQFPDGPDRWRWKLWMIERTRSGYGLWRGVEYVGAFDYLGDAADFAEARS